MKRFFILMFILILFNGITSALEERDFEISPPIVKLVIKESESVASPLSVINNGESQIFHIDYSSQEDFISIKENDIFLDKEKGGTFDIIFNGKDLKAGVYLGEIVISSEKSSIGIPIIMEVETQNIKFDAAVDIVPSFSELAPGEDIIFDVNVYNLGSESGDVVLYYSIKDFNGKEIYSEQQRINVNNQVKITKKFSIPEDAELDNYILSVYAVEESSGSTGTSSFLFSLSDEILKSPDEGYTNYFFGLALMIIFVLIVAFLIINYYWDRQLMINSQNWKERLNEMQTEMQSEMQQEVHKERSKVEDISRRVEMSRRAEVSRRLEMSKRVEATRRAEDLKRIEIESKQEAIRKNSSINKRRIDELESRSDLLDKAYNREYIKKSSYDEGKIAIKAMIAKLKKRL